MEGSNKVSHAHHRRHQTQSMFTGTCGVGPDGSPMKLYFEWISEEKTAKKKSKYHAKGDVYKVSTTMNAAYFEHVLRANGKAIRALYRKLGTRYAKLRVTLQIDSVGGHGTARGHGNFEQLAAMMLAEYNVLLVQQPGSTPQ